MVASSYALAVIIGAVVLKALIAIAIAFARNPMLLANTAWDLQALSNGRINDIRDIVYVRNDNFKRANMIHMADQVGKYNRKFKKEDTPYMLIGPGRWGSADRWLGIPVSWHDISGVGAMIETTTENFKADPSQGSHFFQNITSFRVAYFTARHDAKPGIDWNWLAAQETVSETDLVRHVRLREPLLVKVDGRTGSGGIWRDLGAG